MKSRQGNGQEVTKQLQKLHGRILQGEKNDYRCVKITTKRNKSSKKDKQPQK